MNLGWCDVCLQVKNAANARTFYEDLGFRRVEGDDTEGWAVMSNGDQRLGLFEPQFQSEPISLNFRGGDVLSVAEAIAEKGYTLESGPKQGKNGGASATLRDPDGHLIFLDCALGETKRE